jgi:hypothetical protein
VRSSIEIVKRVVAIRSACPRQHMTRFASKSNLQ